MRKRGRVITKVYACMCLIVETREHVHAHTLFRSHALSYLPLFFLHGYFSQFSINFDDSYLTYQSSSACTGIHMRHSMQLFYEYCNIFACCRKSVKSFIFKRRTLIKRILNSSSLNRRCEVEVFSRFKSDIPANPNHLAIVS
jgi:hypothetical protein